MKRNLLFVYSLFWFSLTFFWMFLLIPSIEASNRSFDCKMAGNRIIQPVNQPHLVQVCQCLYYYQEDSSGLWGISSELSVTKCNSSIIGEVVDFDGKLCYSTLDSIYIQEMSVGSFPEAPKNLTATKNKLYFSVGASLMMYDGDRAETLTLSELDNPHSFQALSGKLYFYSGDKLWVSDGTVEGTVVVSEDDCDRILAKIKAAKKENSEKNAPVLNGRRIIAYNDDVHGMELWSSDGTKDGIKMVKDIRSDENIGSFPQCITKFEDKVFFIAYNDSDGYQIYMTDGENVESVMSLSVKNEGGDFQSMTAANGKIFYSLNIGEMISPTAPDMKFTNAFVGCLTPEDKCHNIFSSHGVLAYSHKMIHLGEDLLLNIGYDLYDDSTSSDNFIATFDTANEKCTFSKRFVPIGEYAGNFTHLGDKMYFCNGTYQYTDLKMLDGGGITTLLHSTHWYSKIEEANENSALVTTIHYGGSSVQKLYAHNYTGDNSDLEPTMTPVEGGCFDSVSSKLYFCETGGEWGKIYNAYWYDFFLSKGYKVEGKNKVVLATKSGLLVSDGTSENTKVFCKMDDINSKFKGLFSGQVMALNNKVVFSFNSYSDNSEFYLITDGTEEGTHLFNGAIPSQRFSYNNKMYFIEKNSKDDTCSLYYKTDLEGDSIKLADIDAQNVEPFRKINGEQLLVFQKGDKHSLVVFDETEKFETLMEYDSSQSIDFVDTKDGFLYFSLLDDAGISTLYSTDGTGEHTFKLFNGNEYEIAGKFAGGYIFKSLIADSETLFYANPTTGQAEKLLNGVKGTFSFLDCGANLVVVENIENSNRIWGVDGSSFDVELLISGNELSKPVVAGDIIYFTFNDGVHGNELWYSDLKTTDIACDIFPGSQSSEPRHLTVLNDKVYFDADNGFDGREIYSCSEKDFRDVPLFAYVTLEQSIVAEDAGDVKCSVVLSGASKEDVTLNLDFSGSATLGDDFVCPGKITIERGETSKSFDIKIIKDSLDEGVEELEITMSSGDVPVFQTTPAILSIEDVVPEYTLTYLAGEHGALFGDATQNVMEGGMGTEVFAVADAGYVFAGWNDGVEDNPRVDGDVQADLSVTALFEKINPYSISGTIKGDIAEGVTINCLGFQVVSDGKGVFEINDLPNGKYILTPVKEGYSFEPASLDVEIADASINDIVFTATKQVKPVITVEDDSYSVVMGDVLKVAAPGVLKNDSIPANDKLEIVAVKSPRHGSFSLKSDGSFKYVPNQDYFGRDSFSYELLVDGQLSDVAKVQINVGVKKITIGSLISLKNVNVNEEDRFKLKGKIVNGRFVKLRPEWDGGILQTVWKRRVKLFNQKIKDITDTVDNQNMVVKIIAVNRGGDGQVERTVKSLVLVPPQIEKVSFLGDSLRIAGTHFGSKVPRVILKSTDGTQYLRCKAVKNEYQFEPVSGRSLLTVMVNKDKLTSNAYYLIVLNKLGVGVIKDEKGTEKLPVVNIK